MGTPTKTELLAEVAALRAEIGALVRQRAQVTALLDAHRAITASLDTDQILQTIVRQAATIAGEAGVWLSVLDEQGRELRGRAASRMTPDEVAGIRFQVDTSLSGEVAATRRPLVVPDIRNDPRVVRPDLLAKYGHVSFLGLPVTVGDRLLGVLAFSSPEPRLYTEAEIDLLGGFAAQAGIALENARLYAEARYQQREAEVMADLPRQINASLNLSTTLQQVTEAARELCASDFAEIALLDPATGAVVFQYSAGLRGVNPTTEVIEPGEGLGGTVLATGRPFRTDNYAADPRIGTEHAARAQADGVVAELGVPILMDGRVEGVLFVDNRAPRPFSDRDERTLGRLGDHAAVAIRNARLYQREQEQRLQLEAIRAIAEEITRELNLQRLLELIQQRAMALLGGTSGVVYLWEASDDRLVPRAWHGVGGWIASERIRPGEGVTGQIFERRQGLIVNDYPASATAHPAFLEHSAITAIVGELLIYREQAIGVITVNDRSGRRRFNGEDQRLLRLFADQAAIAIENARLHEATIRRGDQLEALLRASRTVMADLDLEGTLKRIAGEAARISGCVHVKVLLANPATGGLRVEVVIGRPTVSFGKGEFPPGVGLSGVVMATGEPVFVPDCQQDPRNVNADQDRDLGLVTYLGIPIRAQAEILGVLTFNMTEPHRYSPGDMTYLTSFADQAALAIEKAQLIARLRRSYDELQRTQDELVRTEKLRALGQMATGIAHDLNNMLAAILGQVELLGLSATDPELREALKTLETAATDGAHVVRRLQDFARQRSHTPLAPLDLARTAQEALEITRPRWRDQPQQRGLVVLVRTELGDLPPILGNGPEVREALTNLIFNAVDAMPQGGELALSAQVVPGEAAGEQGGRGVGASGRDGEPSGSQPVESSAGQPEERTLLPSQAATRRIDQSARFVELSVADTGIGMTDEVRQRIFDPFFTTKGGRGTGLGLSVVYGIMERHGGSVRVTSAVGRGTVITLRFHTAPPGAGAPERPPQASRMPPRRVLLIDDDAMVRSTLSSLLRAAGHTVTEADGGKAGLALLASTPVDLVLTDLGMPEVTGWDVAEAVRARVPGLPVVLLTGWGEQVNGEGQAHQRVDRVLSKPIRLEALLGVIAELTATSRESSPNDAVHTAKAPRHQGGAELEQGGLPA